MRDKYISYYNSPIGWLKIVTSDHNLISITFVEKDGESNEGLPDFHQQTVQQLTEYFEGTRKEFQLNLATEGTDFQKKIWELVSKVPFGKTLSYLEIAIESGSEKNTRAVGLANGKNPIPIVIPCHRIVGSTGKLTGYAGGLERKRWLLLHEQKHSGQKLLF